MSRKSYTAILPVLFALAVFVIAHCAPAPAAEDAFWAGLDEATLLKMVGKDKFAFIERPNGKERAVVAMVVDAPPDKVWTVLTDFKNYTKYIRECTSAKVKNASDTSVTVDFKMSLLKAGPVNLASDYTLVYKLEKGKRVTFVSASDKGKTFNGSWDIVPVQAGARSVLIYNVFNDFKSAGSLAKAMVERSPTLQISVTLANAMIFVEQIKRAVEKQGR